MNDASTPELVPTPPAATEADLPGAATPNMDELMVKEEQLLPAPEATEAAIPPPVSEAATQHEPEPEVEVITEPTAEAKVEGLNAGLEKLKDLDNPELSADQVRVIAAEGLKAIANALEKTAEPDNEEAPLTIDEIDQIAPASAVEAVPALATEPVSTLVGRGGQALGAQAEMIRQPLAVPAAETVAAAVEEHLAEEQPATQEVAPAA